MKRKTLLMPTIPEVKPMLTEIFDDHYALLFCYSLSEATAALQAGGIDAVGCSVYFDGGKSFDLLRFMKADQQLKDIPFFTASAAGNEMLPGVEQGLEIATRALGGNGVIPYIRWRRELGDADARQRLLNLFDKTFRNIETA